jgi:hypothetical protein
MKAADVKVGDRIVLDMGYFGREANEKCTVVSVEPGLSLFKDPVIRMRVKRYDGQLVNVADHLPHHTVDLADELIPNASDEQVVETSAEAPK